MKILVNLLIHLICFSAFSQGIAFDKERYNSIKEYDFDALGFVDLPKSYSLRDYAPIPESQVGNSCVGFSVGYSAMSIQFNKEFGITSDVFKRFFSFDPYFIYSIISNNLFNKRCKKPTYMQNALHVLKYYGCKRFFVTPFLDCKNKAKSESLEFASPFKIKSFYVIKDLEDKEGLITKLKKTVSYGRVPVVGISTNSSIHSYNVVGGTVKENGFWKPSNETDDRFGHAVSIIGFNDNKYGGCFEIMNSWGTDYGDNGFMWIKYEDLAAIMDEGYIIETYSITESSCKIGNCNNGYGTKVLDNIIEEGPFYNGNLDGFGLRYVNDESVAYAGYFKNGYVDGNGLLLLEEENSMYFVTSKNGEFLTSELLNFSSTDFEKDDQFDHFLEEMKTMGHIVLSEEDAPKKKLNILEK